MKGKNDRWKNLGWPVANCDSARKGGQIWDDKGGRKVFEVSTKGSMLREQKK